MCSGVCIGFAGMLFTGSPVKYGVYIIIIIIMNIRDKINLLSFVLKYG